MADSEDLTSEDAISSELLTEASSGEIKLLSDCNATIGCLIVGYVTPCDKAWNLKACFAAELSHGARAPPGLHE